MRLCTGNERGDSHNIHLSFQIKQQAKYVFKLKSLTPVNEASDPWSLLLTKNISKHLKQIHTNDFVCSFRPCKLQYRAFISKLSCNVISRSGFSCFVSFFALDYSLHCMASLTILMTLMWPSYSFSLSAWPLDSSLTNQNGSLPITSSSTRTGLYILLRKNQDFSNQFFVYLDWTWHG